MSKILSQYYLQVVKEVILYVLSKTGDIGYFRLMKTIYCADRQNLMRWGDQVTNLDYYARKHGPVPSMVYDGLVALYHGENSEFSDIVIIKGNFMVHPTREPNMDYLSETDKESIDKAIAELDGKNRVQIEEYLHESVYKRILSTKGQHYSPVDIAMSANASEKVIANIQEEEILRQALS